MSKNKNKMIKKMESDFLCSGKMFSNIPNEFEPLRKDLWSLEFPGYMGIDERFAVEASRPKVTNNIVDVKFKNWNFRYKGKSQTESINIKFRDAIGSSVYAKLEAWQREHTDSSTGKGGYAATYKKELTLNLEDPTGAVMQQFILHGCMMSDLDGGALSQDDDGIAEVSFTLFMDSYDMNY